MKKILAICGSTRQSSSNLSLLKAIQKLYDTEADIEIYTRIGDLPHFNPDLDNENHPAIVTEFRETLQKADGFIICTPEYAHGVPGTLKNAVDWTVSSSSFNKRPVLLITASTDGRLGHQALFETLKVIEAKNIDELQLLIQFVKTKISNEGIITNSETLKDIKAVMAKLIAACNSEA